MRGSSKGRGSGGIVAITVVFSMLLPVAVASGATWVKGDVFAGIDSPSGYRVFDNAGTFKEEFSFAGASSYATGCGFTAQQDMWGTYFGMGKVVKFANAHPHGDLQTLDVPGFGAASPESIVFAQNGDFYVGNADGNGDVLKFNSAGTFVDQYDVQVHRGSDFVELAKDQKTLYYNSEDEVVRAYDLATKTQLAPFATVPGGEMYGLRLLPPGDGSGGMLVAHTGDIKRLDASGADVQTYDAPGGDLWFALNLDPNGTSFWSADLSGGEIYRFNIATGAVEVGPINNPTATVAGLCVFGELTAAVPPPPPEPVPGPGQYKEEACGFTITGKTQFGTDADETITGTTQSDHLRGRSGDDRIEGLQGADCLFGNRNKDNITGDDGDDVMRGGFGDDKLKGGGGGDNIRAQGGADTVKGQDGDDVIKIQGQKRGQEPKTGGIDDVICGKGNDKVTADSWDNVANDCEKVKIV